MLFLYFNHFLKCDWSISIISQSFYFVKYFFQSFLTFSFSVTAVLSFQQSSFIIISQLLFFVKYFFSSFFKVFWSCSLPFFSAAFPLYHISLLLSSTFFIFFSKTFLWYFLIDHSAFSAAFLLYHFQTRLSRGFRKFFIRLFCFPLPFSSLASVKHSFRCSEQLGYSLRFMVGFSPLAFVSACLLVWQLLYYSIIWQVCQLKDSVW